ncbi:MAG: hypothetical protein WC966_10380 [Bradymonadales bacterium]|jgi:hypothetical protein
MKTTIRGLYFLASLLLVLACDNDSSTETKGEPCPPISAECCEDGVTQPCVRSDKCTIGDESHYVKHDGRCHEEFICLNTKEEAQGEFRCVAQCAESLTMCGARCVDFSSDSQHCGGCTWLGKGVSC